MNNSINSTSPNFRAKVNLSEVAGRLKGKNPRAIKNFIETETKAYPNDRFDFLVSDNGDVKMLLTSGKQERYLKIANADFNELVQTSRHNIADTFKFACEMLKDALKIDKQTSKTVDKAIKDGLKAGKDLEGTPEIDKIVYDADEKVAKYIKEAFEDDEILSKAKFV